MRAHVLNEEGVIVNTIEVEQLAEGMFDADVIGGGIGDLIAGGVLVPRQIGVIDFEQERVIYLTEVREMRERILTRLAGVGTQLMLNEPPELLAEKSACVYLIQALLDITTIPSVAGATTLAELKAAVKAEYARLVAYAKNASPNLVKTFRQVDL